MRASSLAGHRPPDEASQPAARHPFRSPRRSSPRRSRRRRTRSHLSSSGVPPPASAAHRQNVGGGVGFGASPNTLTEPVWDTVKRDLSRIISNLKLVSEVFAVAFAVLAAGAVILTLNVLLLSLSLLGYCLFPLDAGAVICMLKNNAIIKLVVVSITLVWSSWAAYPFISAAVGPRRKALALYPVFLMYISVGFLIIAID
ncbi:unnamed protein product [Spirodela intermedia]|uniref:Uncharacterized protein n=1 Tax=Spirodela intermedia TaxID=51605 RepID=A0A7I8IA50_SPIIN|nr:unnamed protein product [Spirodela intermedia]CAA6654408.1 unnamed protein product [Spirodela intermedia]